MPGHHWSCGEIRSRSSTCHSSISLFKRELGFLPEGFPKKLEGKVCKGEKTLTGRAGDFMPLLILRPNARNWNTTSAARGFAILPELIIKIRAGYAFFIPSVVFLITAGLC